LGGGVMEAENYYNNGEVTIKNYAYLFNIFSPFLLFFGFIIPIGIIWKYIKILISGQGDISVTFYISIVLLLYMSKRLLGKLNGFKAEAPTFMVTKDNIIINEFKDNHKFRHIVKKNTSDIVAVKFILNSEVQSYGKINNTSLIKRFFKDDIGDGFIEIVAYYILLFSFILFYLPIKTFLLLKNEEPLYLLFKNFLIEFNDGTACIINIYSKTDYRKIIQILKNNNIQIENTFKVSIILKEEK
jgi:hypothetical protein